MGDECVEEFNLHESTNSVSDQVVGVSNTGG